MDAFPSAFREVEGDDSVASNMLGAHSNGLMRIGLASDFEGHILKEYLVGMLHDCGYVIVDFGGYGSDVEDDYLDFLRPLAAAIAAEQVGRGIAICGSGVGVCVAANRIAGVRACLIHDSFSAHQGVECENLNMICLGASVVGLGFAWELVKAFLSAQYAGHGRHACRVPKAGATDSRALDWSESVSG